jgi:hypothetical protein
MHSLHRGEVVRRQVEFSSMASISSSIACLQLTSNVAPLNEPGSSVARKWMYSSSSEAGPA